MTSRRQHVILYESYSIFSFTQFLSKNPDALVRFVIDCYDEKKRCRGEACSILPFFAVVIT